jgi:carboxypeptidase Taq
MEEKLTQLKATLSEVVDLKYAQALLAWDQETYMPPGGAAGRGYQVGTLAKIAHEKFTSDEVGQLLDDLDPLASQLPSDSDDACLIKITRREYQKSKRVPSAWVEENTRVTSNAYSIWEKAKAASDFVLFQPELEKIVSLCRQYASFFQPYRHVYDPLLDNYEPGLKTAEVQTIFNALRPQQVDLLQAIAEKTGPDNSFLSIDYPEKTQLDFGKEVIARFGFDWQRGRQDLSVHPFTSAFNTGDVRITTRVNPQQLKTAIFGSMHEAGHAMYEQGIDPSLERTPLAGGVSMAIHESQSRLWENLVGRSRPFWSYFYPRLQQLFPGQLGNISLDTFYRGINRVEPGLIRVEADEATYNLHIMLRLELEIALIESSLDVKNLPEAWNSRMKNYLGLTPPDHARGVLQDVHWSLGSFGYFSTYALGNLVSVQIWEAIHKDLPTLGKSISAGDFRPLLDWLREKIHRHGSKFEPKDLIRRVTGTEITPEPYLRYLITKYSEIYHL